MVSTPLVSVCCLTYNHASFIKDCLEGFVRQKVNFGIEILIHDDASTDNTAEIVRDYQMKYPDMIFPIFQSQNQYSQGIKPTFVYNFPRARGKYIALCEGDDYWTDPLKLQKQVDFLENNPKYVLSHHNAVVINERGEKHSESRLMESQKRDYSAEELIKSPLILTLTMCFRNLIKEFPDEFLASPNGDSFLISLLGNYGKAKYQSEIGDAVYRMHEGGVWSQKKEEHRIRMLSTTLRYLILYYDRIGNRSATRHFRLDKAQYDQNLWPIYISRGKVREALKSYSKSLYSYLRYFRFGQAARTSYRFIKHMLK